MPVRHPNVSNSASLQSNLEQPLVKFRRGTLCREGLYPVLRQQPAAEQDANTVQQAGQDQSAASASAVATAPSPSAATGDISAADAAVAAAPTVDRLVGLEHALQLQR